MVNSPLPIFSTSCERLRFSELASTSKPSNPSIEIEIVVRVFGRSYRDGLPPGFFLIYLVTHIFFLSFLKLIVISKPLQLKMIQNLKNLHKITRMSSLISVQHR